MIKRDLKNNFIAFLKTYNPNITLVSEFTSTKHKVIVKDDLNILYKVNPNDLLNGHTPSIKSAIDKTDYFIKKSKYLHGNKYVYKYSKYENSTKKVTIICKKHGIFYKSPTFHLLGEGCQKCGNIIKNSWSYSKWENQGKCSNNFRSFKFYIIKCWDNNEIFFKVGKTFRLISERFKNKNAMPYKFEIIYEEIGDAIYISKLEKEYQKKLKEYRYTPFKQFDGCTECFTNILKNE